MNELLEQLKHFFCQTLSFLGLFQIQSLSEQKRINSESRFSKCSLQIQTQIELMLWACFVNSLFRQISSLQATLAQKLQCQLSLINVTKLTFIVSFSSPCCCCCWYCWYCYLNSLLQAGFQTGGILSTQWHENIKLWHLVERHSTEWHSAEPHFAEEYSVKGRWDSA